VKEAISKHRLYNAWRNMMNRCNNKNNPTYKYYGERGITVCDRWIDAKNFIEDMYPTYIEGLTIDRIDNNGGYSKNNCRWTTKKIQTRNTRVLHSHNSSGFRGVYFDKKINKFVARIKINSKNIWLGSFITASDAGNIYDKYIEDNNLEHTKNNSK
jgi:hypothetical protein